MLYVESVLKYIFHLYIFTFRLKINFPGKEDLIKEFHKMGEQMEKFIPKVYSHNDFHIKNMVYDAENVKIHAVLWIVFM